MIITHLSITDFGVFHGLHEFDLRPRGTVDTPLPVILIGGKNGSGKTTILEAVRLCLYGRSALGSRVRKTDYETYIKQRFHRGNGKVPARSARIGVVFEHVHVGEKSTYDAVRSWRLEGQTLHENISIYKNGQIFRDIAPDYWNDFLRDLIPPGVADLFFFDGEQIQALADDDTETAALEAAIGGLLNLDIVERLQSDLNTYIRQQNGHSHSTLRAELETISREYEDQEQTFLELKQDRAGLRARIENVRKNLEEARQALVSEGAQFIQHRTEVEARLSQVEQNLQDAQSKIREFSAGLLPFAVAPDWSRRLEVRLQAEEELQKTQILAGYQKAKADEIKTIMSDQNMQVQIAPNLTSDEWQQLILEISELLTPTDARGEMSIIHHVSHQQRYKLLEQIDEVLHSIPNQIQMLERQIEDLEQERSNLQQMLQQVPRDEIALPLIEEFQELSMQSGQLTEQIGNIDEQLGRLQFQLQELERRRSKVWHKLAEAGDIDQRMEYAAKIQVVLEKYLGRITTVKVQELEQLVAQYFNLLCRKDTIVKEVKIDPKRFTVKLYSDNRSELPKSELSAGEKQLYAMALLWALRSVSGRRLPIIVDTPMGRLDSDHRARLLTEFFPQAAHQLILLSTDTEVDVQAFDVLKSAISHVYRLDFDMNQGETNVEQTYFSSTVEELRA